MRRSLVAALGFLLTATSCGGDSSQGVRFKVSDLALNPNPGQTDRHAHGTCPPGRLTVDFQPGKEITISYKTRLAASLSEREGSIGCSEAGLEEPPGGYGWFFPHGRFARTNRPTRLACVAGKPIDIRVHAAPKYRSATGVSIAVTTPGPSSMALVATSFHEDKKPLLYYHTSRCQVVRDG